MEASLFSGITDKYFKLVVGQITELCNGEKVDSKLLHKTMLTEAYSVDLKWGSTEINNQVVAADVVSTDVTIPLKLRPVMRNASGTLPKIGIKKRKGEKDILDINTMIALGTDEADVAAKIFDDTKTCIKGVDVRNEIMFQQALSGGVALAEDVDDTTVGVRVDFGYKEENTVRPSKAWSNSAAKPVTDLRAMFDKASDNGDTIEHVYLQREYFNYLRNSVEGKQLSAFAANINVSDNSVLPLPTRSNFLSVLRDEFGATFHIVEGSFRIELPSGELKTVQPWSEGMVVGTPSENVGRLVYGRLAEETNPVKNVEYQKSGAFTLVSKYSKNDPLEEFTCAQAMCLPVIDGVSSIYRVNAANK